MKHTGGRYATPPPALLHPEDGNRQGHAREMAPDSIRPQETSLPFQMRSYSSPSLISLCCPLMGEQTTIAYSSERAGLTFDPEGTDVGSAAFADMQRSEKALPAAMAAGRALFLSPHADDIRHPENSSLPRFLICRTGNPSIRHRTWHSPGAFLRPRASGAWEPGSGWSHTRPPFRRIPSAGHPCPSGGFWNRTECPAGSCT